MKKFQLHILLKSFGLCLLLPFYSLYAQIPEPDNVLYGTVSLDSELLTSSNNEVTISIENQGEEIASYTLGDSPDLDSRYIVSIPMSSEVTHTDNYARIGDRLTVRYRSGTTFANVGEYIVTERGAATELNIAVLSSQLVEGVDLNANDTDGDGIPDHVELANGLNPFDPADALNDSDEDGLDNLSEFLSESDMQTDDQLPLVIAPAALVVNATGLFTEVDLGSASAFDQKDGLLTPLPDGDSFYKPGEYLVTWKTSDEAGNEGSATQILQVNPIVNFMADRMVAEGETVKVTARLNGRAARYPVRIPFVVTGIAEANGIDYTLAESEIIIDRGVVGTIDLQITEDELNSESVETVILTMETPINAVMGDHNTFIASITEENLAPRVKLLIEQDDKYAHLAVKGEGDITISAMVVDPNYQDAHTYDWSLSDSDLFDINTIKNNSSLKLDSNELSSGVYTVKLEVSDSAGNSVVTEQLIELVATLPLLTDIDSDGDGIADNIEGFRDTDGDGIPEYLDVTEEANLMAIKPRMSNAYLMEVLPGLNVSLGDVSLKSGNGIPAVTLDELKSVYPNLLESDIAFNGGIFDFRVSGLAEAGDSIFIIVPQLTAIPNNAVYSKLDESGTQWQAFVEDTKNTIFSAEGDEGYCPSSSSSAYVAGLVAGHWCVMLEIEDGGPNDADGLANKTVVDPGGVQTIIDTDVEKEPTTPGNTGGGSESGSSDSGGGGGTFGLWGLLWLSLALTLSRVTFSKSKYPGSYS